MLDHLRSCLAENLGATLTPQMAARLMAASAYEPDLHIPPEQFVPRAWNGYLFAVERIEPLIPELHPLHELHWAETERYRHEVALNPDYAGMVRAERAGRMLQFTARFDGHLVGNLRAYISTSMHTQRLMAREDTLFIHPDYRAPWLAVRFTRYALDCLRSVGVVEVVADVKLSNGADAILRRVMGKPVAMQFHQIL